MLHDPLRSLKFARELDEVAFVSRRELGESEDSHARWMSWMLWSARSREGPMSVPRCSEEGLSEEIGDHSIQMAEE